MSTCLSKLLPSSDIVESLMKLYPSDSSVRQHRETQNKDARVKSMGFSNTKMLEMFLNLENDHPEDIDNSRVLKLSPFFLVALLDSHDSLLTESCSDFSEKVKPYIEAKTTKQHEIQPLNSGMLKNIRENVIANIKYRVKHESVTESLKDYSARSKCFEKNFEKREVQNLKKALLSNEVLEIHNPLGISGPFSFNCFHCETESVGKNDDKKTDLEFHSKHYEKVNIHRILPLYSVEECKNHFIEHHVDKGSSHVKSGHAFILECMECSLRIEEGQDEFNRHRYVCCLPCLREHWFILHSSSDKFLSIYKDIGKSCLLDIESNSQCELKNLDSLFLIRCFLCNELFSSSNCRIRHENVCLARSVTQSMYYGTPFIKNLFSTSYLKKQREKEEDNILVNQVKKYLLKINTESDSRTQHELKALTHVKKNKAEVPFKTFDSYIINRIKEHVSKARKCHTPSVKRRSDDSSNPLRKKTTSGNV